MSTKVTREQIENELDNTEFGRSVVKLVAQLKNISVEAARTTCIEESLKQEALYQERQAAWNPVMKLELDETMARALARKLSCHDDRQCGFDAEEAEALYDLYSEFCAVLEGGATICPDGTTDPIAYADRVKNADTVIGTVVPAAGLLGTGDN